MKIAVIGGGAAGFFGAIQAALNDTKADITLFEKSTNYKAEDSALKIRMDNLKQA